MTKQTTGFLVTSMGKQARVLFSLSPWWYGGSPVTVSPKNESYCYFLFLSTVPLPPTNLLEFYKNFKQRMGRARHRKQWLARGLCTEICLQMNHHILLLLSQPGLPADVLLFEAGPLCLQEGMQKEIVNNSCWQRTVLIS